MLSLNPPPPSPILAGRFAVEPHEITAVNTPPPSAILEGAERGSCIWVTRGVDVEHEVVVEHEAKAKYEVKVTHEPEQVRGYLGFPKSPRLTIA
jgi:hypothetical protein